MIAILVAMIPTAMATDWEEDFGDDISSTCAGAWNGDCEEDWTAAGSSDSVTLCTVEDSDPTDYVVQIDGASSISRESSVDGTNYYTYETEVEVWAFESSTVSIEVDLYNSTTYLETVSQTYSLAEGQAELYMEFPVDGVTDVIVRIEGATNADFAIGKAEGKKKAPKPLPSPPMTAGECNTKAEAKETAKRNACEGGGGTFSGSCSGSLRSNGECLVNCLTSCTGGVDNKLNINGMVCTP